MIESAQEYRSQDFQKPKKLPPLNLASVPFEAYTEISSLYSQAGQDLFVLSCLNGLKGGNFLEIGCYSPSVISNTYLLESEFGWSGISVDINPIVHLKDEVKWEDRTCKIINNDARSVDYTNLGHTHFDFLQLDVDPVNITLAVLKKIPFDKLTFSVITFEHDLYQRKDYKSREESRDIIKSNGYMLLCEDVHWFGKCFEDWYVNPNLIDMKRVEPFKSSGQEFTSILWDFR